MHKWNDQNEKKKKKNDSDNRNKIVGKMCALSKNCIDNDEAK